jgi:hypothetical protein
MRAGWARLRRRAEAVLAVEMGVVAWRITRTEMDAGRALMW